MSHSDCQQTRAFALPWFPSGSLSRQGAGRLEGAGIIPKRLSSHQLGCMSLRPSLESPLTPPREARAQWGLQPRAQYFTADKMTVA